MKVTVEEAKQEVFKRMKKLNFHPNVLSDFKEDIINKYTGLMMKKSKQ